MAAAQRRSRVKYVIPFDDEVPHWLSHIELSREGDEIIFRTVKTSGADYGPARIDAAEFNHIVDALLAH